MNQAQYDAHAAAIFDAFAEAGKAFESVGQLADNQDRLEDWCERQFDRLNGRFAVDILGTRFAGLLMFPAPTPAEGD